MRRALLISLFGLLFLAGAAHADTPEAAQAFVQGRARYEAHDYQTALKLFRQALASSGSPNARIYVARCLREMGQLVEGYEEMSRTVSDARDLAAKEDRYTATRDAAATELAVLEGKVGKVVVALDASLAGASVELNGAALAPERVGVPTAVLPGSVRVVAVARDGKRVEQSTTIAAGKVATVTLSARADAPLPAPVVAPPPEPAHVKSGSFGVVRAAGIGVAAVGVGGFVTFLVGNSIASGKYSTLQASCGAGPCTDASTASVVDAGKTAETVSRIGLGVGIAGVVAGGAMIVFGGGKDSAEPKLAAGPRGVELRLRF